MIYKVSTKGKIFSLKWVILFSLLLVPVVFMGLSKESAKVETLIIFLLITWALFCFPQLNLFLQYLKVTNYQSVEVDYHQKTISISKNGEQIVKNFSDIRRLALYRAKAPIYSGSWWLSMCREFYYYKVDFEDESYYLTSILLPHPILDGEKYFYDSYIEVRSFYANIKKAVQ